MAEFIAWRTDKYYLCETFISVGGCVLSHTVNMFLTVNLSVKLKGLRHPSYQGEQVFGLKFEQLRVPRDFPPCVSNWNFETLSLSPDSEEGSP